MIIGHSMIRHKMILSHISPLGLKELFDPKICETHFMNPISFFKTTSISTSFSNLANTHDIDGRLVADVCTHNNATLITCCASSSNTLLFNCWSVRSINLSCSCREYAWKDPPSTLGKQIRFIELFYRINLIMGQCVTTWVYWTPLYFKVFFRYLIIME